MHAFRGMTNGFLVLGAIVADSWIGKFKTIFIFCAVYVIGTIIISISATEPLRSSPALGFSLLSLVLIAAAMGSIKPSITTIGGDQFTLPQQKKHLSTYFLYFYLAMNLGGGLSFVTLPPLVQSDCYGTEVCYSVSFGFCAISVTLATIAFILGKKIYVMVKPLRHVHIQLVMCIAKGIKEKITSRTKVNHWLDHSKEKFGGVFVKDVKITLGVMIFFLPLIIYWTLYDLKSIDWPYQASLMNRHIRADLTLSSAYTQSADSVLLLIFIPIFLLVIYPLCDKYNLITTPLQRMGWGLVFDALAFFMASIVSLIIASDMPVLPQAGECHLRIYNPLECTLQINAPPYIENLELGTLEYKFIKAENVKGRYFVEYNITGCKEMFTIIPGEKLFLAEKKSYGYFTTTNGLMRFEDDTRKHLHGYARIRTLVGNRLDKDKILSVIYLEKNDLLMNISTYDISQYNVKDGFYTLKSSDEVTHFKNGGVYVVLVIFVETQIWKIKVHEVTPSNRVHIFWQLPQFIFFAIAEILLCPTSYEFIYTQTPTSMKTTTMAIWFLVTSIGAGVAGLINAIPFIGNQLVRNFFSCGLMLPFLGIFVYLARRYKYVENR
jgi:solute carrier family 15 oligopeptide transporter 1